METYNGTIVEEARAFADAVLGLDESVMQKFLNRGLDEKFKYRLSAGAFVVDSKDNVLLVKNHKIGRFLLPGGKVGVTDKRLADTAVREVNEEARGLDLDIEHLILEKPLYVALFSVGDTKLLDFAFYFKYPKVFQKGGLSAKHGEIKEMSFVPISDVVKMDDEYISEAAKVIMKSG